jgi:Glycosyl-transferase for dystroglycan
MMMLTVTLTLQGPYDITYCRRYEPWGIIDRRLMPWFDVRFRGYGRNKIVFTAALNASGFAFEVGVQGCCGLLFARSAPACWACEQH